MLRDRRPLSSLRPAVTLQGCSYTVDSTVPAGEPHGVKPPFPPFSPDPSVSAALAVIKAKGGTAMVGSVTLPPSTELFAGPDTDGAKAGTIPENQSILTTEPVLWTDAAGGKWLAFFLACGGSSLYWAGVDNIRSQNPVAGASIASELAQLEKAAPYTQTGQASLLPIRVDEHHHLVFNDAKVTFPVGRAELFASN